MSLCALAAALRMTRFPVVSLWCTHREEELHPGEWLKKNDKMMEKIHCPTVVIFGCAHRLYCQALSGTFSPLLKKSGLDVHGVHEKRSTRCSFSCFLLDASCLFYFPVRLLRTSAFPVMHSLLLGATTKTDNLEEEEEEGGLEGFPDLTVLFFFLI